MHNLSHCKKNCADTHHQINLFCQIFDQQCLVLSLLVLLLSTVIISKQHFVCVCPSFQHVHDCKVEPLCNKVLSVKWTNYIFLPRNSAMQEKEQYKGKNVNITKPLYYSEQSLPVLWLSLFKVSLYYIVCRKDNLTDNY